MKRYIYIYIDIENEREGRGRREGESRSSSDVARLYLKPRTSLREDGVNEPCGFFVCDCGLPQSDLCPDTDVYERCSMSTGDKGHVKYKIGSVLHRCFFSQI